MQGLAETLTLDGQHAASIPWHRRALDRYPHSVTIRRGLAEALLRKEHWDEGRRFISRPENPFDPSLPKWDGTPFNNGCLLAYHRPDDPIELTIIGLGFVARFANHGYKMVSECPSSLAGLVAGKLRNVEILEADSGQTAARLKKGDIFACAALAELPLLSGRDPGFLPHWLTDGATDDTSDDPLAIGMIGVFNRSGPDAILNDEVMSELEILLGDVTTQIDGDGDIDGTLRAFLKTDMVATDDPAAALLAGAAGMPVVLLLPESAPWWWGDRADGAVWHSRLYPLRRRYGAAAGETARLLADMILHVAAAPTDHPQARLLNENRKLAETLDIVSPYLGAINRTAVKTEELTGGTRNKVFRIFSPEQDLVLRLGRFPQPGPKDHAREIANMTVAAGTGAAPPLYFADSLDGTMLSRFMDGKPMTAKSMRQMENAVAAARLFRKIHALPPFRGSYDIFTKIEQKMNRLTKAESGRFMEQDKSNRLIRRIRKILAANGVPACPAHNDPLSRNFVADGDGLVLLDWECSAMGDPHWEVAMLSSQVGMKGDVRSAYLAEYFGSKNHPAVSRIRLFEAVCRYYWRITYLCEDMDQPNQTSSRNADKWLGWFNDIVDGDSFEQSVKAAEDYRWRPQDGNF